jgi:hypothetical protein
MEHGPALRLHSGWRTARDAWTGDPILPVALRITDLAQSTRDMLDEPAGRPWNIRERAGDWSFVLPLRHIIRCSLLICAALVSTANVPARAQGKVEAHYRASLAGIPIGKGSWVIEINGTHYNAAASGVTTGLMHVLTGGEGTSAVKGTIIDGKMMSSIYAATIHTYHKTSEVRLVVDKGDVKDFKVEPPPDHESERVPITKAHQQNVLDPMTATLLLVPGNGNPVASRACQRKLAVFDGRLRYDLQLGFRRMDKVQAEKGYAGPAVVCSLYFTPIAGHIPSRRTIRYLSKLRDTEIWLAPIAGTRVLVPFRLEVPTPIGKAVLEAEQFVTVATPSRASIEGTKSQ